MINPKYRQILKGLKFSFITKQAWVKIFEMKDPEDFPQKIKWTSSRTMLVYDCPSFSQQLKHNIKHDNALIRNLNSKSSTNKLDYAYMMNLPGTKNYKITYHYQHKLSPDDKHTQQMAYKHIKADKNTYKLDPDTSPDAPVYIVPNKVQLWKYKLIFKAELINKLSKKEA